MSICCLQRQIGTESIAIFRKKGFRYETDLKNIHIPVHYCSACELILAHGYGKCRQ
ncbi:MAG TPA: hypothetical protein VMS89_02215 [Methanoregulaceae archaeon]|nr:hypothetical protein [Methanoregulaceae archaeon]